jgi:4-amino-4-deoxy-L-arabinose transferase-like glycosyltransferase
MVVYALIVRLVAVMLFGDAALEYEFAILVPHLLEGHGYTYYVLTDNGEITSEYLENPQRFLPSAYMPPVYPFFLTGLGYIFGIDKYGVLIIEIIQAFLGVGVCILTYHIAHIKFDKNIALLVGYITASYPMLVFMPSQISAVNVYLFLNCFLLWQLFKLEEKEQFSMIAITAGFTTGLLILARGDFLLYFPLIAIWMLWRLPKARIITTFMYVLACLIIISAWSVRNYYNFGQITPLTISGGINLWQGQNENATGTRSQYTVPPVQISPEMALQIEQLKPSHDYEIQLDKIYMDEAKKFIVNNPEQVISLAAKKFIFYWGYYWGIDFVYPGAKSPLYWLPWFLMLPFFVVGLILSFQKFKQYILFYLYFGLSTGIAITFFVLPRYRIFILPLVIIFAISGMVYVVKRITLIFLSGQHKK